VGDGIIVEPVDVRFEIIWRDSNSDHRVALFDHHFDPPSSGFDAVPYEDTTDGTAADASAGDQLILRITGGNSTSPSAYIPNGDGASANGRIPFIELPP